MFVGSEARSWPQLHEHLSQRKELPDANSASAPKVNSSGKMRRLFEYAMTRHSRWIHEEPAPSTSELAPTRTFALADARSGRNAAALTVFLRGLDTDDVRSSVLKELTAHADVDALAFMARHLASAPHADLRPMVALVVREVLARNCAATFVRRLTDEAPIVRARVAQILLHESEHPRVQGLAISLASETDVATLQSMLRRVLDSSACKASLKALLVELAPSLEEESSSANALFVMDALALSADAGVQTAVLRTRRETGGYLVYDTRPLNSRGLRNARAGITEPAAQVALLQEISDRPSVLTTDEREQAFIEFCTTKHRPRINYGHPEIVLLASQYLKATHPRHLFRQIPVYIERFSDDMSRLHAVMLCREHVKTPFTSLAAKEDAHRSLRRAVTSPIVLEELSGFERDHRAEARGAQAGSGG